MPLGSLDDQSIRSIRECFSSSEGNLATVQKRLNHQLPVVFSRLAPYLSPLTLGHGIDQDFKVAIDTPIISKIVLKHTFQHQQKITPP
jgi:hypothetical protein